MIPGKKPEKKRREGAASYLSPFTGDPARRRTAAQAAADADRRFVVARAVGGREGLGEVAALAQGDAVLEARPAFRRALWDGGGDGVRQTHADGPEGQNTAGVSDRTSDQSKGTHLGGQDWLLHDSRSIGRWVRQCVSFSVSSSAGPILRMQTTVLVRMPPSHVFPHSDQSPMNHLRRSEARDEEEETDPELKGGGGLLPMRVSWLDTSEREEESLQRRLTSSAGGGAFGPGQVVPGEAHLVVPASRSLDGNVELVAYSHVLLLKEDLQQQQEEEEEEEEEGIHIFIV
ncbi:hypothetical protein EYF80_021673 [Liparis tanakae]|uniref:Uncharacterized protein n=1 Tax=Liparis tanakae TaxID=230148 RepID=A0A4Z2HRE3_9TELE|nr:hypothetical protein EYF80_021673 [Liparis tanakae]